MSSTKSCPVADTATLAAAVDVREISFSVRSVRQQVRRSSTFTYAISWLLPRRNRHLFWAWYSYFRWVDDFVDEGAKPQSERTEFVDHQLDLLHKLYAGASPTLFGEEQLLGALVAHDIPKGGTLRRALADLLAAIRFDGQRMGMAADYDQLHLNHRREVVSWLHTVAYFCEASATLQDPPGVQAAVGAKITHILRDLISDCEQGLFNISRQEIAAYRLDLDNVAARSGTMPVRKWAAANVRLAEEHLHAGLCNVRSSDVLRYRLIVAIQIAKYQAYLDEFRNNRFILQPGCRFRWPRFLRRAAANVVTVTLSRNRPVASGADAGRMCNLTPTSRVGQLLLQLSLHPRRNGAIVQPLNDALDGSGIAAAARKKMIQRFIAAYWVGHESCTFIDAPRPGAEIAHLAGLVNAFWALAVIEFDRLVDERAIPQAAAEELRRAWLDELGDAVTNCEQAEVRLTATIQTLPHHDRCIYGKFSLLARALKKHLAEYSTRALEPAQRRHAAGAFLGEAGACLAAQIKSRDQRLADPPHDWRWYYTELLNQKTLGFVVAPLNLWCRSDADQSRRREFERAFFNLNAGNFHWQLLDDLADEKTDTEGGLITAPGFILLSQGMIAGRCLTGMDVAERFCETAVGELKSAVQRSELLCDRFESSSLCDRYRHSFADLESDSSVQSDSLQNAVRCALANCADDLVLPLWELCSLREEQARHYLAAMKDRDWAAARRCLFASKAGFRILLATQEESAREFAKDELHQIRDTSLLKILRIIEMLTMHCYGKARRAALQDT